MLQHISNEMMPATPEDRDAMQECYDADLEAFSEGFKEEQCR